MVPLDVSSIRRVGLTVTARQVGVGRHCYTFGTELSGTDHIPELLHKTSLQSGAMLTAALPVRLLQHLGYPL
jgi:hypothetical protein